HSTEISKMCEKPVIDLMEEQKRVTDLGGTMRLGAYDCELTEDSHIFKAYQEKNIQERHRHRFEFNGSFIEDFESNGMKATGKNPETGLVEVVEVADHPWFVGAQFHPEYKSTVEQPHPLFIAFIDAAIKNQEVLLAAKHLSK
ncbi:MAG: CTP synthase, partial [Arenicella sp.]